MTAPFITTRRVEFCETDMAGIVHFAHFYIYMEQAEHEMFRALELEIFHRQQDGTIVSWPRVSASCAFDAPAYYDDVLEARLTIDRIGEKSLSYGVEFWRGETRIARGELKSVCCRFVPHAKMTSIEIPPEYRKKFETYAAE